MEEANTEIIQLFNSIGNKQKTKSMCSDDL